MERTKTPAPIARAITAKLPTRSTGSKTLTADIDGVADMDGVADIDGAADMDGVADIVGGVDAAGEAVGLTGGVTAMSTGTRRSRSSPSLAMIRAVPSVVHVIASPCTCAGSGIRPMRSPGGNPA